MNPFADLLKDTIFIICQNGKRIGPFKTNLQKGRATIFARSLQVKPGDQLVLPLSDGNEEAYTIIDFQYAEGMMDIPESYTFILSDDFTLISPPSIEKNDSQIDDKKSQGIDHIRTALEELIQAVDKSDTTPEDKIIAKSKIKELLTNPTIASLLGNRS